MFCKLVKVHFRYMICLFYDLWFPIKVSQGTQRRCVPEFLILSALKLPSYGLVVFINMNTEDTNFKTFLQENYLIDLESFKLHIY